MKLKKLLRPLKNPQISEDKEVDITSITDNSQNARKGGLFVAIKGGKVDGHKYILNAIKKGAKVIVGERKRQDVDLKDDTVYVRVKDSREALSYLASEWYGNPSEKMRIIGVTGTDGKTTTANLLHHALSKLGEKVGLISTINAVVDGKEIDTGFHVTNPEPLDLHKYLKDMVDAGCKYAVLEVTSHGIHQKRIAGVDFDVAIMTNITHEHMDYHDTWEEYREVKAELFKSTPYVVLNRDDASYEFIKSKLAKDAKVISYGIGREDVDIYAKDVFFSGNRATLEVVHKEKTLKTRVNLLGHYNISNYLAAIGGGLGLKFKINDLVKALSSFYKLKGRLESIRNSKGIDIFIDFAHTPNSLENVLNLLKNRSQKRLICVFGCAGERDRDKRVKMGEISAKLADVTIVTAEDPRSEEVGNIIKEVEKGIGKLNVEFLDSKDLSSRNKFYTIVPERGEAISAAINKIAQAGDTVVLCGKGHENSMAYNGTEYPWSDHEAVKKALEGKVLEIKR
jgi:UDP-N-acetylmuramoyl-L-alanyl-D-glutamate--2,6-diaminopimelate ligase